MRLVPVSDTRYVTRGGLVTPLLKNKLEEVLGHYVDVALFWSSKRGKSRSDYTIREAHLIGSVLRGVDNSDLDLLLVADKIEQQDYKFIKMYLSEIFFNNVSKPLAIDVFIRPYDEFPERGSFEITDQVKGLLKKYNSNIIGV